MGGLDHYYEILGLKSGASEDEVKGAYRDLVKVWHPDRFSHDPKLQQKAQEKLKEINEAYAKLNTLLFNPTTEAQQSRSDFQQSDTGQERIISQSTENGIIERFHLIGLSKLGHIMLTWGVLRASMEFFWGSAKSLELDIVSISIRVVLGGVLVGFLWALSSKTRWSRVLNWVGLVWSIISIAVLVGLIVWGLVTGQITGTDMGIMQRALLQSTVEWLEIALAWAVAHAFALTLEKRRTTFQEDKKDNVF